MTYFVPNVNIVTHFLVMIVQKWFVGECWEASILSCTGRKRYSCTHGYYHECFWKKVKEKYELDQGRTSPLRRKSNRFNC